MRAVVVVLRNQNIGEAIEVAIVGKGGILKLLFGLDAVFFQHHHEHLRVHDRP